MTVYAPSSSVSVRGLTHMYALPPPRTLSPHLIYTDIIDPRHATFTPNNVEGRNRCFEFATSRGHLNGRRPNTP